jgi:predicted CoA-substrate-specific enzyme activase
MSDETYYKEVPYKYKFFEGLEIGAVSVKWVRRSQDGTIITEVIRHEGYPREVIKEIFERYNTDGNSNIVITGNVAKNFFDFPYYSEAECFEKALSYYNIKPDLLLSLGGETFSIYPMKNGVIKNIISTSKCAAGTGEFIVQQLERMGLSVKQGIKESSKGQIVQLATRCSVHCKSDATHKLNKGECKPEDIAKTLIHDLARKVSEMIDSAQWPTDLIVIAGGVALNKYFIESMQEFLPNSELKVLPESLLLEVFGAALYASEIQDDVQEREEWVVRSETKFETSKSLSEIESLLDYRVESNSKMKIINDASYILGVDAGSTTTKAVLFNVEDNSIGASAYLRTLGNPIFSMKQCLIKLLEQLGKASINIIQCGVTGSAREMVSVYLDNCRSFNEILAHARAATEELPKVDNVFEIGGQDSKFISFLRGVPIDYAMNEGCSAGTGSFLEESASVDMGIPVENISDIALKSSHPIAFGERCAAFINTDLRNALQQGAKQEDVVAGLVYSIADNYLSRIIGSRQIGENILFLGGVALNKSVALAIADRAQRKIIVPTHPELMGSIGSALMTRDLLKNREITERKFVLKDLLEGEMNVKSKFRCNACKNKCEIQNISIRGSTYPFGGLCSKYKLLRQKGEKTKKGKNLVDIRNDMIYNEFGPVNLKKPRGSIGLPMALTSHSLFPLYTKFINELGFEVALSKSTKLGNTKTLSSICYPCELVHGAVMDLINNEVDYIFLPRVLELEISDGYLHGYTCPSTSIISDVIRAAFEKENDRILSPHISTSKDYITMTLLEFGRVAVKLGLEKRKGVEAGKKAFSHYTDFINKYRNLGEKLLPKLTEDPCIIIAGRPYIIYPTEVNIALPQKIASRGYHVIPADILPLLGASHERNVWHYTQQISNAVNYAKKNPNIYICMVSCFSCGPDGTMYHHFRQELAGSTFCYLEIDSHTAHAGFETRVEAFIDIIEERHKKFT